ncbi:MAG: saccharopine dehydrogenase NADP-binding domain-containing protein [Nitrospirae bacterium]|nr:saccharopine dehydrogenase NADP-binding domain-containing protein [Nitrospirota bacterium]
MNQKLKIIVLGGAGDMGSRAVEDLASSADVSRVTIADRNTTAADKIAERLRGQPARVDVRAVDANDHAGLVKALKGYDVAASALGPFHMFEAKLVHAALDAGTDYASICDEWQAAEAVMDKFDKVARSKRRTILTGLGASPGLSNVGIRHLASRLDRARRADIYVYQPLDAGGGEAVLRHMLFIMTGHMTTWRGGRRTTIRACSETRTVEFPRFGSLRLWNMGHAEPVTVPRFMPEIEEVNFLMGYGRGSQLIVAPARLGVFRSPRRVNLTVRLLMALERATRPPQPGEGAVRIEVTGEKNGKTETHMVCGTGQMREVTGISLSIGTLMLGRGETTNKRGGVFAPEGCLDPRPFIHRFRAKGLQAFEDLAMTKPLE